MKRILFTKVQLFPAMAQLKQVWLCSFGLTKRFALMALCFVNAVAAQQMKDYYSGDTVSVDKHTYYIDRIGKKIILKNKANIQHVIIDGEKRYISWEFGTLIKLSNPYVVIEAIEEVFSKEEILEMAEACIVFRKSTGTYESKTTLFFSFDPDVDKNGKIVNLRTSFNNCDVMKNVPPQKMEQLEDYIKKNALYTVKDKEWLNRLQIIGAQPIEVDVNNTDYSFKLMYDAKKYLY